MCARPRHGQTWNLDDRAYSDAPHGIVAFCQHGGNSKTTLVSRKEQKQIRITIRSRLPTDRQLCGPHLRPRPPRGLSPYRPSLDKPAWKPPGNSKTSSRVTSGFFQAPVDHINGDIRGTFDEIPRPSTGSSLAQAVAEAADAAAEGRIARHRSSMTPIHSPTTSAAPKYVDLMQRAGPSHKSSRDFNEDIAERNMLSRPQSRQGTDPSYGLATKYGEDVATRNASLEIARPSEAGSRSNSLRNWNGTDDIRLTPKHIPIAGGHSYIPLATSALDTARERAAAILTPQPQYPRLYSMKESTTILPSIPQERQGDDEQMSNMPFRTASLRDVHRQREPVRSTSALDGRITNLSPKVHAASSSLSDARLAQAPNRLSGSSQGTAINPRSYSSLSGRYDTGPSYDVNRMSGSSNSSGYISRIHPPPTINQHTGSQHARQHIYVTDFPARRSMSHHFDQPEVLGTPGSDETATRPVVTMGKVSSLRRAIALENRTIMDLTGDDADVFYDDDSAERHYVKPTPERARLTPLTYVHPPPGTGNWTIRQTEITSGKLENHDISNHTRFPSIGHPTAGSTANARSPAKKAQELAMSPVTSSISFSPVNTLVSMSPRSSVAVVRPSISETGPSGMADSLEKARPMVFVNGVRHDASNTLPEEEDDDENDSAPAPVIRLNGTSPSTHDATASAVYDSLKGFSQATPRLPTLSEDGAIATPSIVVEEHPPQASSNTTRDVSQTLDLHDLASSMALSGVSTRDFALLPTEQAQRGGSAMSPTQGQSRSVKKSVGFVSIENPMETQNRAQSEKTGGKPQTKISKFRQALSSGQPAKLQSDGPAPAPVVASAPAFDEEDFARKRTEARAALLKLQRSLEESLMDSAPPPIIRRQQADASRAAPLKERPATMREYNSPVSTSFPVEDRSFQYGSPHSYHHLTTAVPSSQPKETAVPTVAEAAQQDDDSFVCDSPTNKWHPGVSVDLPNRNPESTLAPPTPPHRRDFDGHVAAPASPSEISLSSFPLPVEDEQEEPPPPTTPPQPAPPATLASSPVPVRSPARAPTSSPSAASPEAGGTEDSIRWRPVRRNSGRSQMSNTSAFSVPYHMVPARTSSIQQSHIQPLHVP